MTFQIPLNSNDCRPWIRLGLYVSLVLLFPVISVAEMPKEDQHRTEHKARKAIVVVTGDGVEDVEVLGADGHFEIWPHFRVSRGYLGVGLLELTPELRRHFGVPDDAGVMISSVAEESPAMEFGIKVGDILTAIDDTSIDSTSQVVKNIGKNDDGDSVTLNVWRDGNSRKIPVTLTKIDRPQIDVGALVQRARQMKAIDSSQDGKKIFVPSVLRNAYKFRWNSDGAGPHQVIEIHPENFDEAMKDLKDHIGSPEFKEQLLMMQRNRGDLTKRITELEHRLQEMAKELQKLSSEAP